MKETLIQLKLVLVKRKNQLYADNAYTLQRTPISTETLINSEILQLKPNVAIHRIYLNHSPAVNPQVLVGVDNYIIFRSDTTIEYISKEDVEPYILTDYDNARIVAYKQKNSKMQLFNEMILPTIKSILADYPDVTCEMNGTTLNICDHANYPRTYNTYELKHKYGKLISQLKDLGLKVIKSQIVHSDDICRINITKSMENLLIEK